MTLINSDRTLRVDAGKAAKSLPPGTAQCDPIALFGAWFRQAEEAGIDMPEAMMLATSTSRGHPSARMVLLKQFDSRGFVFFTNFGSRKSKELEDNPRAALVLHWMPLERQVRIEGSARRLSAEESAVYFATRPRNSQIGAWASRQSTVLADKPALEARVRRISQRFAGQLVPVPPFWGGWRVAPARIEFWQGQANRLHDRLVFERTTDSWQTHRLYP